MSSHQPSAITFTERARRIDLVRQLAAKVGFCGRVEYRHRYDSSGPAQIRLGAKIGDDVMLVFAEAFDWKEDSRHFSLEAVLAHECGHQVFHHHPMLRRLFARDLSIHLEEIAASIIGALLVTNVADHDALLDKAVGEALQGCSDPADAAQTFNGIRKTLEVVLCSEQKL